MSVEVKQLMVRGTFLQRQADEPCSVEDGAAEQPKGGRSIRVEEILQECGRMIRDALRDQRER